MTYKAVNINPILNSDSYKSSHWLQMPKNASYQSSYIESRGGNYDKLVFFGLQSIIKEYLTTPITHADVDEAADFWRQHGEPFNQEGWEYIVNEHHGKLPIEIQAVPEGTIVETKNVLVQVINTDPKCYWLTSYVETLLMRVWYPITVCTKSWHIKQTISEFLKETSDVPVKDQINFKLHDFGARGVSSYESAGIGGMSHLVNFMGTDTVTGCLFAKKYYNMSGSIGFSIPAMEHSTVTSWGGPEHEVDAFRNMLKQFGGKYPLIACVSDSYNIYNACTKLWGDSLLEEVKNSGSTVVVRPDSGDPVQVAPDVIEALMSKVGYVTNSKGYKVLPSYFRVIQGDGVSETTIFEILTEMKRRKLSAENIAFGMGGELLQNCNRDTLKFAMKCSALMIEGRWIDVYKDPITDTGKTSKKGRLALLKDPYGKGYHTIRESELRWDDVNQLRTVYKNGILLMDYNFDEIKTRVENY